MTFTIVLTSCLARSRPMRASSSLSKAASATPRSCSESAPAPTAPETPPGPAAMAGPGAATASPSGIVTAPFLLVRQVADLDLIRPAEGEDGLRTIGEPHVLVRVTEPAAAQRRRRAASHVDGGVAGPGDVAALVVPVRAVGQVEAVLGGPLDGQAADPGRGAGLHHQHRCPSYPRSRSRSATERRPP